MSENALITVKAKLAERVFDMRMRGASLETIAETLDMPLQLVDRVVGDFLASDKATPTQVVKDQQLRRIEHYTNAVETIMGNRHPILHMGLDTGFEDDGVKLKAIDVGIKLLDRTSKLLGLDEERAVAQDKPAEVPLNADQERALLEEVMRRHGFIQKPEYTDAIDITPIEKPAP